MNEQLSERVMIECVLEFSLGNIVQLESDRRNCGPVVRKVHAKALREQDGIPISTKFSKVSSFTD